MVNPELCKSGKNQSPINIKTKDTKLCELNCNLIFYYKPSRCSIKNINNNLIIDYDDNSHIIFNDVIYNLDIISITIPSSHKINNKNYDMEVMIYHVSPASNLKLVISIMVNIDDTTSMSSKFFEMFNNGLPKFHSDEVFFNTDNDWNIFSILPEQKSFYSYDGSLVNPPCTENVTYIVMDNNVTISPNIYNKIKDITKYNAKQLKPLNKRNVLYNRNLSGKNNINQISVTEELTITNNRNTKCSKPGQKKDTMKYILLLSSIIIIFILFFVIFVIAVKSKYPEQLDNDGEKFSLLKPTGFYNIMMELKPLNSSDGPGEGE